MVPIFLAMVQNYQAMVQTFLAIVRIFQAMVQKFLAIVQSFLDTVRIFLAMVQTLLAEGWPEATISGFHLRRGKGGPLSLLEKLLLPS